MPKAHRVGDQRACGATTVGMGLNDNVFINGQLAAVAGDQVSDHIFTPNPGALISSSPGTVLVKGVPLIVTLMDTSSPDAPNPLLQHVTGLPTPATGSPNVNVYGGSFGGGLGNFGLSGLPNLGELLSFGGNIVGKVYRKVDQGGNSGLLVMNETTGNTQPTTGDTVIGVDSGKTFTFTNYFT